MIDKTTTPATKSAAWSAARKHLVALDTSALVALLKDLYDAADLNRDLIQARCENGENEGGLLEKYRGKVVEQFFPKRGIGKLKFAEARKAIRNYYQGSLDVRNPAQ